MNGFIQATHILETQHRRNRTIAANSKVLMVMAQGLRLTTDDFNSARRIMETTLLQFPDLYFVFVTNEPDTFNQLIAGLDNLGTLMNDVSYLYLRIKT